MDTKIFLFKIFEAGEKTGGKTSQEKVQQLTQKLCAPKDSAQVWKSSLPGLHYHIASSGIFLIASFSHHVDLDIT